MKHSSTLTKIGIVLLSIVVLLSAIIGFIARDASALSVVGIGLLTIYLLKNRSKTTAGINNETNPATKAQYRSMQKTLYLGIAISASILILVMIFIVSKF